MTLNRSFFIISIILMSLTATISFFSNSTANALTLDELKSAVLVDYDSGTVLFEKNSDTPQPPSSMSKLMTLYLAFKMISSSEFNVSADTKFITTKEAWERRGSTMFLKEGQKTPLIDLIKGIIIVSANDACISLASGASKYIGCNIGEVSRQCFVRKMNEEADRLGLTNSHFANESGWPDKNHWMSLNDIATLSMAIYRDFPQYYHLFSIKELSFNSIQQPNTNPLLRRNKFNHLNVDGLKTGKTEEGGYGISFSAINENNRRIFGVVNNLNSKIDREVAASELITYGLYNFDNIKLFNAHSTVAKIKVWANGFRKMSLIAKDPVIVTHAIGERKNIKVTVENEKEYWNEITKDTIVAKMIIESIGQKKEIPLYSNEYIKKASLLSRMWYSIVKFIANIIE